MSETEIPEPDRVDGAPHPRETQSLIGQSTAETAFLEAFTSDRMHHGWLISGPRGVGKATFAWRAARFLLSQPVGAGDSLFGAPPTPVSLDTDPDHPVMHRSMAMAEPGLFLLRRAWDDKARPARLKTVIGVDDVRNLKGFFSLSASDGGRRVVIVDAADEMNVNAANALLKLLEEPPERAVLMLIAHQPARLLPTIRSRCRELRLSTLGPDDMAAALAQAGVEVGDTQALAELSGGSVGEAIRLANLDGLTLYGNLIKLAGTLPQLNRPAALALANSASGKANAERLDLIVRLIDLFLARMARAGAGVMPVHEAAPGEIALFARLCPDQDAARKWAQLADEIGGRMRHGRAVNLDPATLILDTILTINQTAARLAA